MFQRMKKELQKHLCKSCGWVPKKQKNSELHSLPLNLPESNILIIKYQAWQKKKTLISIYRMGVQNGSQNESQSLQVYGIKNLLTRLEKMMKFRTLQIKNDHYFFHGALYPLYLDLSKGFDQVNLNLVIRIRKIRKKTKRMVKKRSEVLKNVRSQESIEYIKEKRKCDEKRAKK